MAKKIHTGEVVSNRAARHHFEVLETLEAGIALVGTEIKSLRDGGGNLQDNYVSINNGEAYLKQASISPYRFGNIHNHVEKRDRKLLLHKSEILKIKRQIEEKGLTAVALSFYFSKGRIKVKIGICRGKKAHDKRESLKKSEQLRDIQQALKRY